MGRNIAIPGLRDSFIEPSFPANRSRNPLRNYPIGHPSALLEYYATKDVLLNNTEKVPTRTMNDVNFAIQREIAAGQGPIASQRSRPWDLATLDFVNVRDLTAPVATSGRYTTSVNDAGAFVPVGTHAEGSASPSIISFTTAAAHLDGIAVVGLFRIDELDTDGVVGVIARGTAATDHVRFEVRTNGTQAHLVTRASSSDTSDADTDVVADVPDDEVSYISVGLRISAADDLYTAVVNGEIVLSGTLSAGAQGLTGNTVGIRTTGAAPGTGVLLFQAIDLKV